MGDLIVSGAVLRWARESFGVNVSEAADLAHASITSIESWEGGRSTPTVSELKRLASAYRRQLATLLLRDPPTEDEPHLPDFRRRTDYTPPRVSPGVHLAIREVRRQQLALAQVAPALGLKALPVGSAQPRDPEGLANAWRERLGVSVDSQTRWRDTAAALRAWRDLVEAAGSIVLQLKIGDEGIRGFSVVQALVPAIALSTDDSNAGRIFTLFHELAHLLIGEVGICQPGSALRYEPMALAEERFCNRFAGAFLVPLDVLVQLEEARKLAAMPALPSEADFGPLKRVFKVSSQVLWYRLRDADLIKGDRYLGLWSLWASQSPSPRSLFGRSQDRPHRAISQYGRRFVSSILEAEGRGYIGFGDVLNYTRVRADEVRKLASLAAGED